MLLIIQKSAYVINNNIHQKKIITIIIIKY